MRSLFSVLFSICFIFTLFSCKNPVAPSVGSTPGRRDYTWTVDTIKAGGIIGRIWGDSPDNVWITFPGDQFWQQIFHFDGQSWSLVQSHIIHPNAIFGIGKNNLFVSGENGAIWHYDGANWNLQASLNLVPDRYIVFENIWGVSPNDIYAVGSYSDDNGLNNNGVIAHYNGAKWELNTKIKSNCSLVSICKTTGSSDYFLLGVHSGLVDSSLVLKYNSYTDTLVNLFTGSFSTNSFVNCYNINNQIFIVKGRDVYIYEQNSLRNFLHVDDANYGGLISGRNEKDIFITMSDGIAHYNGSDIEYIYHCQNYIIDDILTFDKVVFFIAFDSSTMRNYIIRGTLK